MAAGAAAAVIGGTAAGAHQSATAHSAKAAKIQVKKVGHLGKILENGQGHVLYLFEKDKHGKSSCNGMCASAWPPVLTSAMPKAGSDIKSSLLGTTKRANGKLQATYNGHPLYTFVLDMNRNEASGQGANAFGAKWFVMNAKGGKVSG
jgi:predicted lipoprotein with Yx(FWY)xxD motif